MKGTYEVTDGTDRRAIAEFLKSDGQFLLPMVELVDRAELAIDEVIEVIGRATIEAVLDMSAEAVAGPKQGGRARGDDDVVWYGRQRGQVYLSGWCHELCVKAAKLDEREEKTEAPLLSLFTVT